jgi:hypothetical protein
MVNLVAALFSADVYLGYSFFSLSPTLPLFLFTLPHLPLRYTIQEGPDGRTPKVAPTFWFWHNEVGHLNASSIFDGLRYTVGHGA